MHSRALVLTLIVWSSSSFAAAGSEMATSGTQFMIDTRVFEPAKVHPRVASPAGPITDEPASRVAPAPAPTPAPGANTPAPVCLPNRPYKGSTPFKIHVDQLTQTATVTSPDFPNGQTLSFPVSTGGGTITRAGDLQTSAKVPHPDSKTEPYCPETKAIAEPKLITTFQTEEFAGRRDCTEEQVRGRSTVFPGNSYRSGQFDVIMPNAMRFRGGQFFHRCPSGETCGALKSKVRQPISGECVRVPGWERPPQWMSDAIKEGRMDTSAIAYRKNRYQKDDGRVEVRQEIEISETLVKQAQKYGAYEVTMSEPPPMRQRGEPASKYPYPTRIYCDEEDIRIAKMIQARRVEPDGGWDAPNFGKMIGDFFSGIFGGGQQQRQQRMEPARPETPEERRERLRRERRQQREREELFDRAFGHGG